jgi:serine/threonine-protein kinase
MGEVWKASHSMLARPAAVKLIHPEALAQNTANAQTILSRFEQEAQATASLRSPHTVELYDFGHTEDGAFYYVMELLEGLDVASLVENYGPQEPGRVIHILDQVCHSLQESHGIGLIHRDIKPANLFLCRYGSDDDFVKVLDFGLVKEVRPREANAQQLTQQEVIMGTPGFMPPELALGDGNIDGRADLYALGCVAYWLLTGEMLFSADSPMQVLMKHVNETPEVPSRKSELTMPPELDAIIMKCLEKDPANRPSSADELSSELHKIPLERPWKKEHARQWWETHRPVLSKESS